MRAFIRRISLLPVLLFAAGSLLAGTAAAAGHSAKAAGLGRSLPTAHSSQSSGYVLGGRTGQGGPVVFDVSRNGRMLKRADGALELNCSNGNSFIVVDGWRNVAISRRGSFKASARDVDPGEGGTVEASFDFAGTYNRRRKTARGTWRAQMVFRATDGTETRCDSGTLRFSLRR
jgi:hypothetical protein